MIASMLFLSIQDMRNLKITDAYSIHRVVYGLFDLQRNDKEKLSSIPSGFLYADKDTNAGVKKILIVSDRYPSKPPFGKLDSKIIPPDFLQSSQYCFEVIMNPTKRDKNTGKLVPIRGHESIGEWFIKKSMDSWGFTVRSDTLKVNNIDVQIFEKKGHRVTQALATIVGELTVCDREKFISSFQKGLGRGRAFGCGLLQIRPLKIN